MFFGCRMTDLSLPASQGLLKGVNRDVVVCYAAILRLSRRSDHVSREVSHRTSPKRKIPTPTMFAPHFSAITMRRPVDPARYGRPS